MHRRRRGEGAVYRRKDGRWEARLRLPDGRRTSIYTSTRRRAVTRLADAGWRIDHGLSLHSAKRTVADYLNYWPPAAESGRPPSRLTNSVFAGCCRRLALSRWHTSSHWSSKLPTTRCSRMGCPPAACNRRMPCCTVPSTRPCIGVWSRPTRLSWWRRHDLRNER